MFQLIAAFSRGVGFHKKGVLFGFQNPSFLLLSMLPFVITLFLYGIGFYFFSENVETWLQRLWHLDPGRSAGVMGWLYWAYIHVVKFLLYCLLLVVVFYTFIVISNIVASPFYDFISTKYEKQTLVGGVESESYLTISASSVIRIVFEEVKKALFAAAVPIGLVFVPMIGPVLSFFSASVLISWDFVDYSLARRSPFFSSRLKAIWRHKFFLFGYGCPLVIPFLGLLVLPFAILGATILYHEVMEDKDR